MSLDSVEKELTIFLVRIRDLIARAKLNSGPDTFPLSTKLVVSGCVMNVQLREFGG